MGFGEEGVGIGHVLHHAIRQTEVDRRVGNRPPGVGQWPELVQKWVLPPSLVEIDPDHARDLALEDPQVPAHRDAILGILAAPATDVENYRVRGQQRMDARVEGDRAVDVGEASEATLGIELTLMIHRSSQSKAASPCPLRPRSRSCLRAP